MEKNKTGPKPKNLKEGTIVGLQVGRGENKQIVPPDQVEELASIGCTDREIAAFFKIKEDTLRYNFADNLQKGREFQKTRLRQAMFKNACVNMNAAVQIFLAKNVLGMSDQAMNAESNTPLPWIEGDIDESDEIKEQQQDSHSE